MDTKRTGHDSGKSLVLADLVTPLNVLKDFSEVKIKDENLPLDVPLSLNITGCRLFRCRRIAAITSTLRPVNGEAPVARASGLLLRTRQYDSPYRGNSGYPLPSPARETARGKENSKPPIFFHERLDTRPGIDDTGRFVWMRMELGLVAGEPTSPFQMAVAMMDMTRGSGLRMEAAGKQALALGDHAIPALSINVDSTSYWERPFTGEWLGMRPSVISQKDGITTVSNVRYSKSGRVGTAMSSGLIQTI